MPKFEHQHQRGARPLAELFPSFNHGFSFQTSNGGRGSKLPPTGGEVDLMERPESERPHRAGAGG